MCFEPLCVKVRPVVCSLHWSEKKNTFETVIFYSFAEKASSVNGFSSNLEQTFVPVVDAQS